MTGPRPLRWGLHLLSGFCLVLLSIGAAQPGPPPHAGPPAHRGGAAFDPATFNPAAVVAAGTRYLGALEPMFIFEHVHGRRGEKREVKVLLGDGARVYAKLTLDPLTLEPVPLGLEGVAPPLPGGARPEAMLQALTGRVPEALSLSAVVVPERRGYKLFLVYEGRMVGELRLTQTLEPYAEPKWLDEYAESRWRYP